MYFSGDVGRRVIGVLQLLGVVTFLTLATPATSRNLGGPLEAEPIQNQGLLGHQSKMEPEEPELHPIDACIFSCDLCFKNNALVTCANACISSDGAMDRNWRRICKAFEETYRFGFH